MRGLTFKTHKNIHTNTLYIIYGIIMCHLPPIVTYLHTIIAQLDLIAI